MQMIRRLAYILMWLALWGSGLIGIAAGAMVIDQLIRHQIHCNPPTAGLSGECRFGQDATMHIIVNYLPFLIPLVLALLIRFLLRRRRRT